MVEAMYNNIVLWAIKVGVQKVKYILMTYDKVTTGIDN
jgi:hypothetical protein